uniref:CDK5RAP1-like protein n=2 Tax=Lygus hesperus TaxID=30085 RepID=A0A146MGS9_LYGHE
MNVADTNVIHTILQSSGLVHTDDKSDADIILLNTCAVRDSAEQRIWGRVGELVSLKRRCTAEQVAKQFDISTPRGLARSYFQTSTPIIGLLGCMAERLKHQILTTQSAVRFIVGPDAYRSLPAYVAS